MTDKPIIRDPKEQNAKEVTTKVSSYQALASGGYNEAINKEQNMDSEEAQNMSTAHYVNATTKEIEEIKWKLMDSIHFNFNERECNILYRLAAFDLLTSSDCKSAIMLMAQKLGNIAIPKEEDE